MVHTLKQLARPAIANWEPGTALVNPAYFGGIIISVRSTDHLKCSYDNLCLKIASQMHEHPLTISAGGDWLVDLLGR